jgi:ATP-binding cassette, subfamily B, bacterial
MDEQTQIKKWLIGYAKRYWLSIIVLSLLSLLKIGFQLLNPWPIKVLIDSVFGDIPAPGALSSITSPVGLLIAIAFILIALYLLQNMLAIFNAYWSTVVNMRFDMDVKHNVFTRLMNISLRALNRKSMGDYLYRLNSETTSVREIVVGVSRSLFESSAMIIGSLAILFYLNWRLATMAVMVVPFLYIAVRYFSGRIEAMASEVEVNNAAIHSHTTNSVMNIRTIQAFDQERRQSTMLHQLLIDRYRISLRNLMLHAKFGLANDMITTVAISVLIVFGGIAVLREALTIGELLIFLTYISYLFGPLETVNSTIGEARKQLAAAKRVHEVIDTNQTIKEPENPIPLTRVQGYIDLVNVSFWYDYAHPILRNINLKVLPGQRVLLIGPSGSGKSSLINLIPRFYEASGGVINIDGQDIRNVSLADLRRQFSIVSQEPMLVAGSVGENIAFGSNNPEINAESIEVIAASQAAGAHEFIEKLSNKYNTIVGEGGVQLSGGQKQRIAIARAFLKDAPILLLDEPTSALDQEAEQSIVATLQKLMLNRTTFIVTHREALLQNHDIVYLVKDGTVTLLDNPQSYLSSLGQIKIDDTIFTQMFNKSRSD